MGDIKRNKSADSLNGGKKRNTHQYTAIQLQNALRRIREEGLPIREASREYNIPRGTLQDKVHGRTKEDHRKMGPNTIFTLQEEKRLVNWIQNLARCGFPQTPSNLLDAAQRIVTETGKENPFKEGRPGKKWYYAFLKRHPEISLRTPEGISTGRAVVTEEVIRKWFDDLRDYLKRESIEEILADPTRIFNLDETSFSLAPKTGRVLAPRGERNIYQIKRGNEKETLTVLLNFSANGEILSPLVVFPYLRPPKILVESIPDDWALGRSKKGWMTAELFFEYIRNNVIPWLVENKVKRPILLLLDGHKSHMSIQLSDLCSTNGIILYCLPPNTTHILQPADVGVFKGLKSDYKLTVLQWQSKPQNMNKCVTKLNFTELLKTVFNRRDRTEAIKNSFRKCGLFPFNPDAVDYTKCVQNILEDLNRASSVTPGNEDFETAKRVVKFIEQNLREEYIDPEAVVKIISDMQRFIKSNVNLNKRSTNTEKAANAGENSVQPSPGNNDALEGTYVVDDNSGQLIKISEVVSENLFSSDKNLSNLAPYQPLQLNTDSLLVCSSQNQENALDLESSSPTLPSTSTSLYDKLLPIPKPFAKKNKNLKAGDKFPMCISSQAWKDLYLAKETIKINKKTEIERRKEERNKRRLEKETKPATKKRKTTTTNDDNKLIKTTFCNKCNETFEENMEVENLKKISCRICGKGFHFRCTTLQGVPFAEADKENFICNSCKKTKNKRNCT